MACGRKNAGNQIVRALVNSVGQLNFSVIPNGFSANALRVDTTALTAVDDNEWHFFLIRQKADGTGPEIYVDGSWAAVTRTVLGTATLDDWWQSFDVAVSIDAFRLGRSSATTSPQLVNGEMSHFAIWDSALSDASVNSLYNSWLGEISYSTKTIRRKGRRLFSANL